MNPALQIDGLTVRYRTRQAEVTALRDVHLGVAAGEVLAVVGESGSGKSTLLASLLGLLPTGTGVEGTVTVQDFDPVAATAKEAARWRFQQVGYVPQLTQRSLVPVLTVAEHFRQFGSGGDWRSQAVRSLTDLGLRAPETVLRRHPHELSGGMAQRVCIALATFAGKPLLVADEPTSGLDPLVTVRVADLLLESRRRTGSSLVLVTHNLRLARRMSTRIAVFRSGVLVEHGPAAAVLEDPLHPYTRSLIAAVPEPGRRLVLPEAGSDLTGTALVEKEPGHYVAEETVGAGR
ncbi:ATP-binding cassette domain-containing protein [Kineosporia succinea]|uniref:ABC-type dipeptide/oligopeptide/nickel transport system ATPase component n=1 Tax=Kineosporia succinea TaxID=84632 RepID=A0ABT9PCC6_9ACTN|nr:ABC transporter ATP-binding protein [Kineosporia succinea]MDP9830368.1 ABC-type dipeptide/oligopeptide/nickel transport system ATPase component [Kineosporia succinea]